MVYTTYTCTHMSIHVYGCFGGGFRCRVGEFLVFAIFVKISFHGKGGGYVIPFQNHQGKAIAGMFGLGGGYF